MCARAGAPRACAGVGARRAGVLASPRVVRTLGQMQDLLCSSWRMVCAADARPSRPAARRTHAVTYRG